MNAPNNPFETPVPRGMRALQATLRVGTAVQCFGLALAALHHDRLSTLTRFWVQAYELAEDRGLQIEHRFAYGLLVAGFLTLVRPTWFVLIPLGSYQIALALAAGWISPEGAPLLIVGEQACRFALPWGLLLIDFWPPQLKPSLPLTLASVALLRGAAIAASLCWGIAALLQYRSGGPLVDAVVQGSRNLLGQELDTATAEHALAVIGVFEIGWALCLTVSRNRFAAAWMSMWGFFVAFSTILTDSPGAYDVALSRFGDGAAPLTVLLFWLTAVKESRPTILPEEEAGPASAP